MPIPRPLKWILWGVGTLAGLFLAIAVLFGWLMSSLVGEPSNDEVARVISPNGAFDAVLFETNGGATTSFGYDVYIVEHGAPPKDSPAVSLYGAVRNQSAYGANLKWVSPDLVAVEYLSTKSSKINMPVVSVRNQAIRLVARDGIADNTAPAGGMLYNLRGRQ